MPSDLIDILIESVLPCDFRNISFEILYQEKNVRNNALFEQILSRVGNIRHCFIIRAEQVQNLAREFNVY